MTHIESVEIFDDGVDIVYRKRSNTMFLTNPPQPCPDHVWKEQWRIVDGKLQLSGTIKGVHIPQQIVSESMSFVGLQ
jgi:hypothetical protein